MVFLLSLGAILVAILIGFFLDGRRIVEVNAGMRPAGIEGVLAEPLWFVPAVMAVLSFFAMLGSLYFVGDDAT